MGKVIDLDKEKIKKYTISHEEHMRQYSEEERAEIKRIAKYIYLTHDIWASRKELDLTQQELSNRSGIPRATISKIESGSRNVTIDKLMHLAEAMGKTLKITLI